MTRRIYIEMEDWTDSICLERLGYVIAEYGVHVLGVRDGRVDPHTTHRRRDTRHYRLSVPHAVVRRVVGHVNPVQWQYCKPSNR